MGIMNERNRQKFHLKNQFVRDMIAAGVCVLIGIVVVPNKFLFRDDTYYSFIGALALGFGLGWLIRSSVWARQAGKLIGNKIVD